MRGVIAASLGNALEWFDIVVYGFFAATIAGQFFPTGNPATSLLIALGTFGVSFFIRPLGAVVLGAYADRHGRKAALLWTIVLMMVGTAIIALTPPFHMIGVTAPILIIVARLIQGFSAGGEFASATAFLAEQSVARRGFYSSWQFASQGVTSLLAAGFGTALTAWLTPAQIDSWGWRIPFLFGLLIGPVALYIRRHVDESPEFVAAAPSALPLAAALSMQRGQLLIAVGTVVLATVAMYLLLYMQTFAVRQLALPAADGFHATLVVGLCLVLITPVSGAASDRFGRLAVAIPAAIALVLLPMPLFVWLTSAPSAGALLVVETILAIATAVYLGAVPALLTELFPVGNRTTAMSVSYNLSVMTFGGLAPFFVTWLLAATGWAAAPSAYLTVAALLSLTTLTIAYRNGVR